MAKKISSKDLFDQEDIFKGIRDSAEKTLVSLNKINEEFKQTAATLKQSLGDAKFDSSDSIKKFTQATAEANKIQKQAIEIEKLKEQVKQQAIKSEKEQERLAQERIKTQKAEALEKQRIAKESEKAAKNAEKEGSAYAKLSKQLNDARKAYKDLAVQNQQNSDEGRELLRTITDLDTQLKKVDATVGQHQRNVGNYEGATANLKLELRQLTRELQNMSSSDPRFQEMAQRAGELRDTIQDTQAVVKATAGSAMENFAGSVAKVGQIGVAAFQGMESSMVLLGIENEEVLKSMQKLQALAGLGDALQTLGGLGDMLTEISAGFTAAASKMGLITAATEANTAATVADTAAQEAAIVVGEAANIVDEEGLIVNEANAIATGTNTAATVTNTAATVTNTAATEGATIANNALNTSLLKNPYILIVAGIAAATYALYKFMQSSDEAAKKEKIRNQVHDENLKISQQVNQEMAEEISQFKMLMTQLSNTNAGSKERSQLITEINNKYGTTLKNMSNEAAFQAQINATLDDYIKLMKVKALMDINVKKHTKSIQDQSDAEDRLIKYKLQLKDVEKKLSEVPKEDYMMEKKKYTMQKDAILQNISDVKEQIKIHDELQEVYAQQNMDLREGVDLGKYQPPPPPTTQQNDYNDSLQQTVDLTEQIRDEQIKQIEDEKTRRIAEVIENAKRRKKDIQDTIADATQKAQLLKLVEENMLIEIGKITDEYSQIEYDKEKEAQAKLEELRNEAIANEKRRQDELLNEAESFTEERQRLFMNEEQNELRDLEDWYFEKRNIHAGNDQALLDLEVIYLKKRNDIDNKYRIAQSEKDKKDTEDLINKEQKANEQRWKTIEEFGQKTTDFFKEQSDKRIAQIDKEIAAAEKQADFYRELAAQGNIDAEQSLAEQQRIIAEGNRKKEQEQRRQQQLEVANSILQTYAANAAQDPKTALTKTISDATVLWSFIKSLPMFYEGTEDTGVNGRGVDGKGGFHAILHPNERVIPKSLNDQIGGLTNEELTRIATQYQSGRLVGQDVMHSSLELAVLVNEMKDLKEVIKRKPETNIELGEITQSAMEIVKSTRQGNTVVYNRFKVRK